MKIDYTDFVTGRKVDIVLNVGEEIEYIGKQWRITNLARNMSRLEPVGHSGQPMWVFHNRLFNEI